MIFRIISLVVVQIFLFTGFSFELSHALAPTSNIPDQDEVRLSVENMEQSTIADQQKLGATDRGQEDSKKGKMSKLEGKSGERAETASLSSDQVPWYKRNIRSIIFIVSMGVIVLISLGLAVAGILEGLTVAGLVIGFVALGIVALYFLYRGWNWIGKHPRVRFALLLTVVLAVACLGLVSVLGFLITVTGGTILLVLAGLLFIFAIVKHPFGKEDSEDVEKNVEDGKTNLSKTNLSKTDSSETDSSGTDLSETDLSEDTDASQPNVDEKKQREKMEQERREEEEEEARSTKDKFFAIVNRMQKALDTGNNQEVININKNFTEVLKNFKGDFDINGLEKKAQKIVQQAETNLQKFTQEKREHAEQHDLLFNVIPTGQKKVPFKISVRVADSVTYEDLQKALLAAVRQIKYDGDVLTNLQNWNFPFKIKLGDKVLNRSNYRDIFLPQNRGVSLSLLAQQDDLQLGLSGSAVQDEDPIRQRQTQEENFSNYLTSLASAYYEKDGSVRTRRFEDQPVESVDLKQYELTEGQNFASNFGALELEKRSENGKQGAAQNAEQGGGAEVWKPLSALPSLSNRGGEDNVGEIGYITNSTTIPQNAEQGGGVETWESSLPDLAALSDRSGEDSVGEIGYSANSTTISQNSEQEEGVWEHLSVANSNKNIQQNTEGMMLLQSPGSTQQEFYRIEVEPSLVPGLKAKAKVKEISGVGLHFADQRTIASNSGNDVFLDRGTVEQLHQQAATGRQTWAQNGAQMLYVFEAQQIHLRQQRKFLYRKAAEGKADIQLEADTIIAMALRHDVTYVQEYIHMLEFLAGLGSTAEYDRSNLERVKKVFELVKDNISKLKALQKNGMLNESSDESLLSQLELSKDVVAEKLANVFTENIKALVSA